MTDAVVAERFGAPALWNDTGQPLAEPVGLPAELLDGAGSIDAALDRFQHDPVLQRLAGWDRERILRHAQADRQPVPAGPDRVGYYGDHHLAYWLSGLADYALLAEIAEALDRPIAGVFLDFGAATGRVLRHLADLEPDVEAFGIDLCRQHVAWARQHLIAPVLQGTALPTLPFADRSVDVIFAGSVFTHINDFEEAWLAELRRVLRPTGFAAITFQSERGWAEMQANPRHPVRTRALQVPHRLDTGQLVDDATFEGPMPAGRVVLDAVDWPDTDTFHSDRWVHDRWGRFLRVARIIERSHGRQDCAVLVAP